MSSDNKSYKTPTSLSEVREWVTGEGQNQGRASETILLHVQHSNLKATHFAEIRMDQRTTIADVKQRLYLHTGTRPDSMRLQLISSITNAVQDLFNEQHTLQQMNAYTGDTLLIIDEDPFSVSANGGLEDTSLVPKYVLSDEAYEKKENTYRKFKQKMREKDPKWSMTNELMKRKANPMDISDDIPNIQVGNRVQIFPGEKRGTAKFVGRELKDLPAGWWVGVEFDEPVGKNDGLVKGVRYFSCEMGYGGLARPSNVTVGDFKKMEDELDLGDDSEDEI